MNNPNSSRMSAREYLRGDQLAFSKEIARRRKRMELASTTTINSSTTRCGGGGGGEMRRIHIIYFLSRMGRIEQPHLIRLHHHNRNGVFLRDVKRWLGDLRGKEMPEAFAWSYKRRYKTGNVWQDLLDDDLITPISDNEYVLKGSQIFVPSTTTPFDGSNAQDEKKGPISKVKQEMEEPEVDVEDEEKQDDDDDEGLPSPNERNKRSETPTRTSTETSQESSPTFCSDMSTLTQDSLKQEEGEIHGDEEQQSNKMGTIPSSSSFYSNLLGKKKMNINIEKIGVDNSSSTSTSSSCSSQSSFSRSKSKSKSYSNGTSKMLQNLFSTCGAVNTNDAALVPLKKSAPNSRTHAAELRSGERLGGSARTFGTSWNQQHRQQQPHSARNLGVYERRSFDGLHQEQEQKQQQGSSRVVSKSNMPVAAPLCSHCSKPFRPEKLHNHMKSCKGMKAFARKSAAAPSHLSGNPPFENSNFGFLLTN